MRALSVAALRSALITLPLGAAEGAAPSVGLVKFAKGPAFVQRGDEALPARPGLPLLEGDVLRAGADGRLGVVLRDDTGVSLGPETEIRIDRFVFARAHAPIQSAVRWSGSTT